VFILGVIPLCKLCTRNLSHYYFLGHENWTSLFTFILSGFLILSRKNTPGWKTRWNTLVTFQNVREMLRFVTEKGTLRTIFTSIWLPRNSKTNIKWQLMLITNKLLTGEKDHLSCFNLRKKNLYAKQILATKRMVFAFCKPNLHKQITLSKPGNLP